jgi:hypothetical protein
MKSFLPFRAVIVSFSKVAWFLPYKNKGTINKLNNKTRKKKNNTLSRLYSTLSFNGRGYLNASSIGTNKRAKREKINLSSILGFQFLSYPVRAITAIDLSILPLIGRICLFLEISSLSTAAGFLTRSPFLLDSVFLHLESCKRRFVPLFSLIFVLEQLF